MEATDIPLAIRYVLEINGPTLMVGSRTQGVMESPKDYQGERETASDRGCPTRCRAGNSQVKGGMPACLSGTDCCPKLVTPISFLFLEKQRCEGMG